MANQTLYTFKANLKDLVKLQVELDKATAKLKTLKKTDAEFNTQQAKVKNLGQSFKKQSAAMAGATTQANKMNKAGGKLINTFKSAAVAIGAAFAVRAIVGSVKKIISTFTEFEAQMAAVKAISGATADEFNKLEATALKLGASTVFTATEVAKLQEEFARLGFTVEEIDNATLSTLNLAAATGESLSKSAQIAGSTIRAFNLDAEQTQRVVDVMAQSFTNSALNLDRFTESMKFVAPVARATGFTLEETSSLLMQLADNGLSGSIAGNALKNIFLKLGDANSKLAKKLGGTVQGIPQLAAAMKNLSAEGFSATEAVELLDKRSAPAFLALIKNIDGLQDSVDILHDAEGAVNLMAAIRLDTLQGDFTILKSSVEGLSIALGDKFDLSLRNVVYSLTKFIQGITESESALNAIKTGVKIVQAAIVGLTARFAALGLAAVVKGIYSIGASMIAMARATRAATASTKALKAAFASTPWGLVIQLVTTVAASFLFLGDEIDEVTMKQDRLNEAMEKSLADILAENDATKERATLLRAFVNDFPELLKFLDLERASNAQLLELKKLMGKEDLTSLQEAIKVNKQKILLLNEEFKAKEGLLEKQKASLGKVDSIENRQAVYQTQQKMKIMKRELQALKNSNKSKQKEMSDYISKLVTTDNLIIKDGKSLRKTLQLQYLQGLADFRKIKVEGEKEAQLEIAKARLEFLEDSVEYNDILADSVRDYGEVTQVAQQKADLFLDSSKFKDNILNSKDSIQDLGIELGEIRKYVSNLESAFVKAGDGIKGIGNSAGFALNKTKDQFKKLNKLFDDMLDERIVKAQKAARQEFDISTKTAVDELKLMETNKDNLTKFIDTGSKEELAKLIKANKSKYAAIKTLTAEQYADATNAEKGNKAEMLIILQAMLDEEEVKIKTSNDLKIQLKENYNAEIEKLRIDGNLVDAQILNASENLESLSLDRRELNFFKAIKQRTDSRNSLYESEIQNSIDNEARELKNLKSLHDKKKLSDKEYQDAKTRIEQQGENDRGVLTQEKFDDDSAAAIKTIEKMKMYYDMAFEAFSTFFTNKMELEKQSLNNFYNAKSEDLDTSLERELESLEGNEEAQEDVRERYAILQEVNQAKLQEELTKIKKKQFKVDKANDIASAIINGYLAITKVSGETGLAAIVAAPFMSTFIAAQIAAIASTKFIGAKGGIIPGEKFANGGMVSGPSHANGGVKFAVGGRVSELEGGEAVINKRSTAMFRSQLSSMNEAGGGVRFADGGVMPGTSSMIQQSSVTNTTQQFDELALNIVSGINNKQVTVSEAAITNTQTSVSVSELTANIF